MSAAIMTLLDGPDGWSLAPEGAAVHVRERTAVIADVHLGYEWARAGGGDQIPAHSLVETLAKLDSLLARAPINRLVVAGDLVESSRPCVRTMRDVNRLSAWLAERKVTFVPLLGNHDPPRRPPLARSLEIAGWSVAHGHLPMDGARLIFGHHHPALRVEGRTAPCFLVGPALIALPAFSPNAAGLDVIRAPLPAGLRRAGLRCVAGAGAELLDFGPLDALSEALRGR